MERLTNVLLSLNTWTLRICGYPSIEMRQKFEKDHSIGRLYSMIMALCLVVSEIYNLIETQFRYKTGNSVELQVVLCLIDIFGTMGATLAIVTESFIYINENVQLYNNFVSMHDIFFETKFTESKLLSDSCMFFVTCMLLQVSLMVHTIYVWGLSSFTGVLLWKSLVITLMVIEVLYELYCCNFYLLSLNESVLLRYADRAKASDETDFRPTNLDSGAASVRMILRSLREKKNAGSIEHVKVYQLLIQNIQIISQRFTYTFISTICASFLTFVTTAKYYISGTPDTNQLISQTTWLLVYLWYLASTSIAMEHLYVQVEKIIRNINKIIISEQKDLRPNNDAQRLLKLMVRRKLRLVIGGVMQVDFTFVYSVLAMTTSYIIIFIQMDHS